MNQGNYLTVQELLNTSQLFEMTGYLEEERTSHLLRKRHQCLPPIRTEQILSRFRVLK